jgi:hypothetical protein
VLLPEDVLLVSKAASFPMRCLGWFLGVPFMTRTWTTYRLPFQRCVRITYPEGTTSPNMRTDILNHELVHVEQFRTWWGPWLIPLAVTVFPLPLWFSGRWWVERYAYLEDIRANRCTVDRAVFLLWAYYLCPWPRTLMRAWFARKLVKVDWPGVS